MDWVRSPSSIAGYFIVTRWRDSRRFLRQWRWRFPGTSSFESLLLHKFSKTGTFLHTFLRIHLLGARNGWVSPSAGLRGWTRRCRRHKCPYSSQLFIRFVKLLQSAPIRVSYRDNTSVSQITVEIYISEKENQADIRHPGGEQYLDHMYDPTSAQTWTNQCLRVISQKAKKEG